MVTGEPEGQGAQATRLQVRWSYMDGGVKGAEGGVEDTAAVEADPPDREEAEEPEGDDH
jgi:hypothetical protein